MENHQEILEFLSSKGDAENPEVPNQMVKKEEGMLGWKKYLQLGICR